MWTAIFLIWLSPLFGGQGDAGKPMRATIEYPDEAGCRKQVRELEKYQIKHVLIQGCEPKK